MRFFINKRMTTSHFYVRGSSTLFTPDSLNHLRQVEPAGDFNSPEASLSSG